MVALQDETVATTASTFKYNPADHLIKVKGNALYLQVKDRLVWLRTEHPTAKITTRLMYNDLATETYVVHATVELEDGSIGEGLAAQSKAQFSSGPLEKAETKAIGRALATLGFGTQWALELDEQDSFADSPVNVPTTAAGVEALREEVIKLLDNDLDAKNRLPKSAGEMTEDELSKCMIWLRQRALVNK